VLIHQRQYAAELNAKIYILQQKFKQRVIILQMSDTCKITSHLTVYTWIIYKTTLTVINMYTLCKKASLDFNFKKSNYLKIAHFATDF